MTNNPNWARNIMQERHGYKNVSDLEAHLWEEIGDEEFLKIIDYGFRMAYWSVKYKNLSPEKKEYKEYFVKAREVAVNKALELIYNGKRKEAMSIIKTDEEIKKALIPKMAKLLTEGKK